MVELLLWACAPKVGPPVVTEPSWVQVYTIGSTGGLPTTPCNGELSVPPRVARPLIAQPEWDMSAWRRVNPQTTAPVDFAALPAEPLRGDPQDIAALHPLFQRARKEKIHVGVWGDSHASPDVWIGEIRREFQQRYGDAGHGLVFPAAPWPHYQATDVEVCTNGAWRTLGASPTSPVPAGPAFFAVEASDPAAWGWVQTPADSVVSRLEVLYVQQPGGGHLRLTVDDAPVEIATGGPWGPGLAVLRLVEGPHRLTVAPVGDGPVRLAGMNMERGNTGVVVDNLGRAGMPFSLWLKVDVEKLRPWLDRRPYDLAVLEYGSNDGKVPGLSQDGFRQTLTAALQAFRRLMPQAACLVVGPGDRGHIVSPTEVAVWDTHAWINQIIREVAPGFHCVTWDLQAAMGGPGSSVAWRKAQGMNGDLTHLSEQGYREMGRMFMRAVGEE